VDSIKEGDLHKPNVSERRGQGRMKGQTSRKRKDRKSRINSTKKRRVKNKRKSGGRKMGDGGNKIDEAP
jgi:hypothetical protein